MPTYIFRILENDGKHMPSVIQLIETFRGKCNTLDTMEGFIYETEFEADDDLKKFKAELGKMFAGF